LIDHNLDLLAKPAALAHRSPASVELKMRRLLLSALLTFGVMAASPAAATVHQFEFNIPGPQNFAHVFGHVFPAVTVSEGDTLDVTFNFANPFVVQQPDWAKFYAQARCCAKTTTSGTFEFLTSDPNPPVYADAPPTQSSGSQYAYAFFDLPGGPFSRPPLTVNGAHVTMTIHDIIPLKGTSETLAIQKLELFFQSTTPEPSTWATMLLGFGLLGAALRQRRSPARSDLA